MSATAYDALIAAKAGLTGTYLMEDASGTVLTATVGANGTLASTGITYGAAGGLANEANEGLAFDATSNPATIPDAAAVDLGDQFWIAFWVKRSATQGANQTLLNKGTNAYQLRFSSNDTLAFLKSGGAAIATTRAITDQGWHLVVVTKDATTTKLYLDSVDETIAGTAATLADTANVLRIAHNSSAGAERFPGSMARLAFGKNAVLSATEVAELWRVGRAILGIAAETDAAQPVTPAKAGALGRVDETDTAQLMTPAKAAPLAQATETDAAQPIVASKAGAAGQAQETDTALPVTPGKSAAAGQALEVDAAQPITAAKSATLGQASETGQALSITPGKSAPLGIASETDGAQPITASKSATLGLATEADVAQTIRPPITVAIGIATETDAAFPITRGSHTITYVKPRTAVSIDLDTEVTKTVVVGPKSHPLNT